MEELGYDWIPCKNTNWESFLCPGRRPWLNSQKPKPVIQKNVTALNLVRWGGFHLGLLKKGFTLEGCDSGWVCRGWDSKETSPSSAQWGMFSHWVLCHFWGQHCISALLCVGADVAALHGVITEELASSSFSYCDVRWYWVLSFMDSELLSP